MGDVREVFIAKKRNKNGRRYGFVRFKGVEDMLQLEKKLDNIVFGGLKMFVNIPKFGRAAPGKPQPVDWRRPHNKTNAEENRHAYLTMTQRGLRGAKTGLYVDAVKGNNPRAEQGRLLHRGNFLGNRSQSEVQLDIPLIGHKWLNEAWVGRLKNLTVFDKVEDDILWDCGANVSPRYIGDDMVLLLGLTDDKARQMMDEENEGGRTMFHTMEKWNPRMRPGHRLTWIQCWGIPLIAWDMQQIKKIVAGIGEMVEVDDNVEGQWKMDMARILLKTPWKPLIQHTVRVNIQGEIFQVHITEEGGTSPQVCMCRREMEYNSSDEIQSEESQEGSLWWITAQTSQTKEGSRRWAAVPPSQGGSDEHRTADDKAGMNGDASSSSETRSIHHAPDKFQNGKVPTSSGQNTNFEPKDNNSAYRV